MQETLWKYSLDKQVPTIVANAHSLLSHVYEHAPEATVYMASMIGFPGCPVCS